jgi:hypothetical protein
LVFCIEISGLIAFFGELGDAVVDMGTRRRGGQQNLIMAIQGSIHNLLCGQSYPLLAIEARISGTQFAGVKLQFWSIYGYSSRVILSDMGDLIS